MTAVLEARGLGKRYRSAVGAGRLHAVHPGRACGGPGRPERRREDHAAEPGRRPAAADAGHDRGARRPAGGSPAQLARVGFVAQDTADLRRAVRRRPPPARRAAQPGWDAAWPRDRIGELGLDPGAEGREAVRRAARPARPDPGHRQAARAADPRRAGRQPRPAGPPRVPAGPDGGDRRPSRIERRAVLAPGRRPGAGLRLPDRARRRPRAGRRGGRANCSPPTTS